MGTIFDAIRADDLLRCYLLLEKRSNAHLLHPELADGRNVLMYMCTVGMSQPIPYLIELGLEINAQDKNGFTALHHAVYYNQYGCVSVLLGCGADPRIRNGIGYYPEDYARGPRYKECMHLFGIDK